MRNEQATNNDSRMNPNPILPPPEKRFQKGVSGNPNGRPKGSLSFRSIIEAIAEDQNASEKERNKVLVVKRLFEIATSKTAKDADALNAITEIIDRIDGKPKQTIEQTNIDGPDLSGLTVEELRELKHGEQTEPADE